MRSNRREAITLLGAATTLAVAALAPSPSALAQTPKPNILFILVDNLGYGELGVYGGGATRGAPTPRIDRLASEGLRLTNMNMAPAHPLGNRSQLASPPASDTGAGHARSACGVGATR